MKVVFILLICIFVVLADNEASATTQTQEPLTYNRFMELTETGKSKVDEAVTKVSSAVTRSRLLLGLGVVGGVVAIGLTAYDAYHQITDLLRGEMYLPTATPHVLTGTLYGYGYKTTYAYETYVTETCSGNIVHNPDNPSPGRIIVGYKVEVLRYSEYSCGPGLPVQRFNVYRIVTYYDSGDRFPHSYGRYSPQVALPQTSAEAANTQIAIDMISSAIERLSQPQAQILPNQREELRRTVQGLSEALNILQSGVSLQRGVDYALREQPAPTPTTSPSTPPSTPPTTPPTTPPSTAPTDSCECSRQSLFNDAYERVTEAAQAAPMLALINKLIFNPSAGRPNDVIGFNTPFGYVSFDLKKYNYHAIVGAFRFVVLAGAFVAAYYIMFT